MSRAQAFATYQQDITAYSRDVIRTLLHPYQTDWANYTIEVARSRRNETIVVEMPRQSGKNETSAQLEVSLLSQAARSGGDIVKCAPTWKPQIVNSKLRFEARSKQAAQRLSFLNFKPTQGYIYQCGRASLHFLSADPNAAVVGATASLLMEIDEAQDIEKAKFNKDFSPMRASTGAPVIAYGTTWTDDTLLEGFKRDVQEGRVKGRVFRVLPDVVAASNRAYGDYVDGEVRRMGRDHPLIKTQYFLEPLPQAGRMFKPQSLRMMASDHTRSERRSGESQIVAGLDFAGADESAGDLSSLLSPGMSGRDSVALTVGGVTWVRIAAGIVEPVVRILARYEWQNVPPDSLHTALYEILWQRWKVDRLHCDGTGIGATGTAFLRKAIDKNLIASEGRVHAIVFDSAWNVQSGLAFQMLAATNGGRLLDYQQTFDPLEVAGQDAPDQSDPDRHAWWQRGHARLEAKASKRVRAYVPSDEGHDDLLTSEMLMMDAAYSLGVPQQRQRPRTREY